jgi:hypothetical protein
MKQALAAMASGSVMKPVLMPSAAPTGYSGERASTDVQMETKAATPE